MLNFSRALSLLPLLQKSMSPKTKFRRMSSSSSRRMHGSIVTSHTSSSGFQGWLQGAKDSPKGRSPQNVPLPSSKPPQKSHEFSGHPSQRASRRYSSKSTASSATSSQNSGMHAGFFVTRSLASSREKHRSLPPRAAVTRVTVCIRQGSQPPSSD